ncbi:MAG: hypothetical protein ACRCR9_01690 [Chitinophagaceae bacterium]
MEMNYNDYNEPTNFDYKNYTNEGEVSATKEPNRNNQKKNNVIWIILLLLLLLVALGTGGFFFMNNKKLMYSEAALKQDKIVLLSKIDSLENELISITNHYKLRHDKSLNEIVTLKKRINYFKNLIYDNCNGKLKKAYGKMKVYQQQIDEMQTTINNLKSIIEQLKKDTPNKSECEERVQFVIDSILRTIPQTLTNEVKVIDTLVIGSTNKNMPTFTISNFKFTGVYYNKKQPDVDLETILTHKMQEYMVSFDLEADKIVAPRFIPTIYVAVISNNDGRTMSASEDQPDVFVLDGETIEYTISDVPDFGDKIRATMQMKWPALKSNKPKDTKATQFTIIIYTDKVRLGEFQGTLQYGKSPVFW